LDLYLYACAAAVTDNSISRVVCSIDDVNAITKCCINRVAESEKKISSFTSSDR